MAKIVLARLTLFPAYGVAGRVDDEDAPSTNEARTGADVPVRSRIVCSCRSACVAPALEHVAQD